MPDEPLRMNPGSPRVRYDRGMKTVNLSARQSASRVLTASLGRLLKGSMLLAMLLGQGSPASAQPQPPLPTIELQAGIHLVRAEVAADNETRMRGLMFRERLGPNQGMLFVFQARSQQCFWMRNTLIPLTIAFIEDDGSIVNLADMKPRSEDSHCSARPVRYALEMEQGWFAKRGLGPGVRLSGPSGLFVERR
ncbi:MAG: hypothetical protein RIS35_3264 [Pseudomonadota bacterium]|jgi:uncharacterized membrane protein (UPF0127 family)